MPRAEVSAAELKLQQDASVRAALAQLTPLLAAEDDGRLASLDVEELQGLQAKLRRAVQAARATGLAESLAELADAVADAEALLVAARRAEATRARARSDTARSDTARSDTARSDTARAAHTLPSRGLTAALPLHRSDIARTL